MFVTFEIRLRVTVNIHVDALMRTMSVKSMLSKFVETLWHFGIQYSEYRNHSDRSDETRKTVTLSMEASSRLAHDMRISALSTAVSMKISKLLEYCYRSSSDFYFAFRSAPNRRGIESNYFFYVI